MQAVKNTEQCREMIKDYTGPDDSGIVVELPDYDHLERPFIEVFTLDSSQCAACTYMMAAANAAKAYFGDKIDVIEYKYTIRENVARCKKVGISNLPTMASSRNSTPVARSFSSKRPAYSGPVNSSLK